MSSFTLRRFILQNILAVAMHCPVPTVSRTARAVVVVGGLYPKESNTAPTPPQRWLAALFGGAGENTPAKQGSFALVSAEEMAWIRRQREEAADESRIVFDTQPSKSLCRGLGGGLINLALGAVLTPVVLLALTLEKIRTAGGIGGVVVGPIYGLAWSGIFFTTAMYAAGQQMLLSAYYALLAGPFWYCASRHGPSAWGRLWCPLSCRFEAPCGQKGIAHPLLSTYDDDETLRCRALKRLVSRRAHSSHKTDDPNDPRNEESISYGGVSVSDYYGLLGVKRDASERQIKAAYNRLVLKIHPDHNPSPEATTQFTHVTRAYRVLSSPEKRKKYDLVGAKGVDNADEKKREAVCAIFGGEALQRLVGGVFLNSFSYRVIDGLDFTQEELSVLRQRMYERCRDELLTQYIQRYQSAATEAAKANQAFLKTAPRNETAFRGSGVLLSWDAGMKAQLLAISNTGLSKEVLHAVGQEYRRVVQYFDAEYKSRGVGSMNSERKKASLLRLAVSRLWNYLVEVGPHRWRRKFAKLRYLTRVRGATFRDSESMVDLAWYFGVEELERTARMVATSILYDPHVGIEEVLRRREALLALSELFISQGQPYKGANRSSVDQLINSLREYHRQRERKFD